MKTKLLPLLGGLCLLFLCSRANAGDRTAEAVFATVVPSTAPLCVSVSTSAWTAFPPVSTANNAGRDGIYGIIQSTSTNDILGLIAPDSDKYTTPTTTVHDFRFFSDSAVATLRIPDSMRLWLKSVHTAADTFCGREFRQK